VLHPTRPVLVLDAGLDGRHDRTDATIHRTDSAGEPVAQTLGSRALQTNLGGWAELLARPTDWLQADATLRADAFVVSVLDPDPRAARAAQLSPRGRVELTPVETLTVSASAGRSLQSPEARAVIDGARAPLTSGRVLEGGLGWSPHETTRLRSAVFQTDLDDELVFDHTVARYVSGGTTRRRGASGVVEIAPIPALLLLVDVTYADARFTVSDEPIPFAPRWLTSSGVFFRQLALGDALITGGLRVWTLGRRPLPDGFVSRPAFAGDLTATVQVGRTEVSLAVDNVLGNRWRDGEFLYPSYWNLDAGRSERAALHVTAGEPFAARASIGYHFR
jgi:hypothetical protein